jgi:hypothetical protein
LQNIFLDFVTNSAGIASYLTLFHVEDRLDISFEQPGNKG